MLFTTVYLKKITKVEDVVLAFQVKHRASNAETNMLSRNVFSLFPVFASYKLAFIAD